MLCGLSFHDLIMTALFQVFTVTNLTIGQLWPSGPPTVPYRCSHIFWFLEGQIYYSLFIITADYYHKKYVANMLYRQHEG